MEMFHSNCSDMPACTTPSTITRLARAFVKKTRWRAALVLSGLVAVLANAAYAGTDWKITDLDVLGGEFSEAHAINDKGQITGSSSRSAFLYDAGVMIPIGPPTLVSSSGLGINECGQVVGYYFTFFGSFQPFIYENGVSRPFHTEESLPFAINDAGTIAGMASLRSDTGHHAVLFHNDEVTDLDPNGASSRAYGLNNQGQVVGAFTPPGGNQFHAFLYENQTLNDLGTLGGLKSEATGINEKGQIVGRSTTASGSNDWHAFLFKGNKMHDLGTLGGASSEALGINNKGHVVGSSMTDAGAEHAFLYAKGKMVDLNSLSAVQNAGWDLKTATAINNLGQIVGGGTINGQYHAFLLTPVAAHGEHDDNLDME